MIDFETAVVYFFVAMAVAGFCLPSVGMVVGGFVGVIGMTAIHFLDKWIDNPPLDDPLERLPQGSLCFAPRSAARCAIRSYMAAMSSM